MCLFARARVCIFSVLFYALSTQLKLFAVSCDQILRSECVRESEAESRINRIRNIFGMCDHLFYLQSWTTGMWIIRLRRMKKNNNNKMRYTNNLLMLWLFWLFLVVATAYTLSRPLSIGIIASEQQACLWFVYVHCTHIEPQANFLIELWYLLSFYTVHTWYAGLRNVLVRVVLCDGPFSFSPLGLGMFPNLLQRHLSSIIQPGRLGWNASLTE